MCGDEDVPTTPSTDGEAIATPGSPEVAPTSIDEEATTRKPRTLPQSDWHFAFGPEKWYWVRIGGAWRFVWSNNCDWNDIGIRDPSWVAFKHINGFLIGGEDEDGEPKIVHSWNNGYMVRADEVDDFVKSRDAYEYLHEWLDKKQLEDTSLSIGPKGSYFARCGSTWISHGLPKDLMTKLERNKDEFTPIHVALGLHGSWIVLWSDGDLSWKLKNSYPELAQGNALTGGVGQVLFVALNPYEHDGYFIAGENGCSFNANLSSKKDCRELQKMVDDYIRMRAKRDNATFNYPVRIDGVTQNVYVTPNTYETRAGDSILETWRQRRHMLLRKDNVAVIGAAAVATGVVSRLSGASPLRAMSMAAATGVGGSIALFYGIRDGLRSSR